MNDVHTFSLILPSHWSYIWGAMVSNREVQHWERGGEMGEATPTLWL